MDRLSTNLIASQARISVGNLYQFYPNKDAILCDLLRRWQEQTVEVLNDLDARFAKGIQPEECIDGILRALGCNTALNSPGYWNLRAALERSPELSQFSHEQHEPIRDRITGLYEACAMPVQDTKAGGVGMLRSQVTMACLYTLSQTATGDRQEEILERSRQILMTAFDL